MDGVSVAAGEHGERAPGYADVWVERDVACRLRDGVVLRADVYRPASEVSLPVLLMRLPYGKTTAGANWGYAHPAWYASRGYVVVVQDVRGRFASEGEFYPFRSEAEDGCEAVEWAARRSGSNGSVGMYGFSYPGATQLLAATRRPPSLRAIAPGFTSSQFYDGWAYAGGAFSLAAMAGWATFLALESARRRGDDAAHAGLLGALAAAPALYWKLPLRDYLPLLDVDAPYFRDWLAHDRYDDYWRATAIDEDFSRITVPGLHTGGWYDIFHAGTVRNFRGINAAPQKLVLGPWQHSPWRAIGVGPRPDVGANEIDDWQLRFFDQVLKGRQTGVFDAACRVFVLAEGWRDLADWPPAEAAATSYYLHSQGRANSAYGDGLLSAHPPAQQPADVFLSDPMMPSPSLGGHSCCAETIAPMGPADQEAYEALKTVLVYSSQPLEQERVLLGDAAVELYASSTAPDTDFTTRLCIVDRDGRSTNLKEGIIRARFRDSFGQAALLEPGRVYRYSIPLGPIGLRLQPGQRLRLDISSSDFPQWDRNLNTGGPLGTEPATAARVATQAVYHDPHHPSRLILPLLPTPASKTVDSEAR
jgi:putative CocE/NonD family hydrolase